MFVGIKFIDDSGREYIEPINVCHIVRVAFLDIKNIDTGVSLHMRNGDVLPSPEPMDIISHKINQTWQDAASIVLTQILLEYAEQDLVTKLKPRKRK